MLLLGLLACLKYEEGRAQEGELACDLREVCDALEVVGYDDVEVCIAHATSQDWPACEGYRAEQMEACLDAWEAAVEAKDCTLTTASPAVCAVVCGG
jgi:hypothetical protein